MANTFPGIDISLQDCVKLVRKFLSGTFKRDSQGNYVPLNKNQDSLCCWIPKSKLDALFTANDNGGNPSEYGLRVYIGMHSADDSFVPEPYRTEYEGQHTVILVVTKQDGANPPANVDMIDLGGGTSGSFAGRALEVMLLCPPRCEGAIIKAQL